MTAERRQDAGEERSCDIHRTVEMACDQRPALKDGQRQNKEQPARISHGKAGAGSQRKCLMPAWEGGPARPNDKMFAALRQHDRDPNPQPASQPKFDRALDAIFVWGRKEGSSRDKSQQQCVDGIGEEREHLPLFGRERRKSCTKA